MFRGFTLIYSCDLAAFFRQGFFFCFFFLKMQKTHSRSIGQDTRPGCVPAQLLSCVQLSATPWTVAHQAPLSMGFSGKNTGVGSISSSRGSSQPRDRTQFLVSPALAGRFFTTAPPGCGSFNLCFS